MNAFFSTEKISATNTLTAVNVGHQGDSGFRSVAAGIIDSFLVHPHLNTELLSKIINRYFIYYPNHRPKNDEKMMVNQLMEKLISELSVPELIETMAYTLRQFAVDELMGRPSLEYSPVYRYLYQQADKAALREHDPWMDKTSILALARALNIPIDIRVLTPGKELPLPPFAYNSEVENSTTNPKVMIELEGEHYRPRVLNPKFFNSTIYESAHPLITPIHERTADIHRLQDIQAILQSQKQRMIDDFEHRKGCLMSIFRAGELSKKQLLDVYIKYVDRCNSLLPEEFQQCIISHSYLKSNEEEMVESIVVVLSQAIAFGQLHADDLFEHFDTKARSSNKNL